MRVATFANPITRLMLVCFLLWCYWVATIVPVPITKMEDSPFNPAAVPGFGSVESELRWIKSAQRDNGAIALYADRAAVVPYFANLAALSVADTAPDAVLRYMQWYLKRLNAPDRFGLHGTIYDRFYDGEAERSTEDYDSADSYSATFLMLVKAYVSSSDDSDWVVRNLNQIETVAGVILALQDSDGLVWAKPNHKMKYLMDNCENFRGLSDWAEVLVLIGEIERAQVYLDSARRIRAGIESKLWDESRQAYLWGIGRVIRRVARNDVWYPDNVAQVYPLVFGVVEARSERALAAYDRVNRWFPDWPEHGFSDPFAWTIMGYAAARITDVERAERYLNETDLRFISVGRPPPWHSMESSFYVLASHAIAELRADETARSPKPEH